MIVVSNNVPNEGFHDWKNSFVAGFDSPDYKLCNKIVEG